MAERQPAGSTRLSFERRERLFRQRAVTHQNPLADPEPGGQGFDKVIRRLLGLDAKMRQYRDGARFCRAVIDAVGMDGFNRVWTSPNTLPTRQ